MNTHIDPVPAPVTIVATIRPVAVTAPQSPDQRKRLRKNGPAATTRAKIRQVWTAAFVGGPHTGLSVSGQVSVNAAVGALIRAAANEYDTHDEIVDFVASLFGFDPTRTADVHLARAVRLAGKNPRRVHPGVKVLVQHTADTAPDKVAATVALLAAAGATAKAERATHEIVSPPAKCGAKTRVTESEGVSLREAVVIAEAGEPANYGAKVLEAPAAPAAPAVVSLDTVIDAAVPKPARRAKAKGGVA